MPGAAIGPITRMPSCSVPDAQFPVEQIIPSEIRPYVLRDAICEAAGQRGAGQRHDDRVADDEIRCAADDPARLVAAVRTVARARRRPVQNRIGFFRPVSSSIESTVPTTSAPVGGRHGVHVLDLEPDAHQRIRDLVGGGAGRQGDARRPAIPVTVASLRPPIRTQR